MPDQSLSSLFRPNSVALVGASNDPAKFGGKVALNIQRSAIERKYFVNAGGGDVLGERSYVRLEDLPETPETVVLAVPADATLKALRTAGELGAKAAVVFASGFREVGPDGAVRQRELAEIADKYQMAVLGPNCVGTADLVTPSFLGMSDAPQDSVPGSVALVAQSGSLASALGTRASGRLRYIVSTGNEAVVTTAQLITHLSAADSGIRAFALIMEAIHDRDALARAADAARERGQRVVLLKLTGGKESSRVAALHTGAVSGEIAPLEAFCRDHGIVLTRSLRTFNAAVNLLSVSIPIRGNRVGIFTPSGGAAVLGAQFATSLGLRLPQPSPTTCSAISELLGMPADRVLNPLDTTGIHAFDAERVAASLGVFAADGGYDIVLVPLGGVGGAIAEARASAVCWAAGKSTVPIVPVWQLSRILGEEAFRLLELSGHPFFTEYETPLEVLALLDEMSNSHPSEQSRPDEATEQHTGGPALSLLQSLTTVADSGARVAAYEVLPLEADVDAVAARLGLPLALKASHPQLLHKSDAGLVTYPIRTAAELKSETARMRGAANKLGFTGAEIVAQSGVVGGFELLCGFVRDVEMGPHVVLGAGGIYTEILKDSSVALLDPAEDVERRIVAALRRLKIWPILTGARGREPYDWQAAVSLVAQVGSAFVENIELEAIELNPVVVLPPGQGACVVDARILATGGGADTNR